MMKRVDAISAGRLVRGRHIIVIIPKDSGKLLSLLMGKYLGEL